MRRIIRIIRFNLVHARAPTVGPHNTAIIYKRCPWTHNWCRWRWGLAEKEEAVKDDGRVGKMEEVEVMKGNTGKDFGYNKDYNRPVIIEIVWTAGT